MTPEAKEAESQLPEPTPDTDGFVVSWTGPEGDEEHGPLQVLWSLIEAYRIDIFDVSLNKITDDFVSFMAHSTELRLEQASAFTVMAARLLFHKSRALLPDPGFDEPDEEPRLPPELIQQLLEYRKFQMAAEKLQEVDQISAGMFVRQAGVAARDTDQQWLDVTLVDLIRAYAEVLKRVEEQPDEEHEFLISMEEYSVEDKIAEIRALLSDAVSFSFFDLFAQAEQMSRLEIIAVFLALLELTKLGEIILRQKVTFDEIHVFRKSEVVR